MRVSLSVAAGSLVLRWRASGARAPTPRARIHRPMRGSAGRIASIETAGSSCTCRARPTQLGFQHGYLLAPEIADLLRVMKPLLQQLTKKDWAFYRKAAASSCSGRRSIAEYQQEIDGIVAGVGGAWRHGRSLGRRRAQRDRSSSRTTTRPGSTSSTAQDAVGEIAGELQRVCRDRRVHARSRIVMGHNAWTDYVVGSRWNIMFDLVPAKGHRILMDGLPGIIVSDDDFDVKSAGS